LGGYGESRVVGVFGGSATCRLQADVKNLNPLHIAAVGIAATFVFVVGLMLLVEWVVATA